MKFKHCPGYDADTETTKEEIGSAGGQILYKETEIILSERCSALNLVDNFDCSQCPLRGTLLNNNIHKNKKK